MGNLAIAVQTLLTLIASLIPSSGVASSAIVDNIIVSLIQILPIVAQGLTDLIVPIKNIISALQTSGGLTADQLAQLIALDKQCDDAFDAAAAGTPVTTLPRHHRLKPPKP